MCLTFRWCNSTFCWFHRSVMNAVRDLFFFLFFFALGSNGLVARPVFHDYFSMTQPVVTARWEEKDWEVKMAAVASGGWRWVTGLPSFRKPVLASFLGAIYRETAFKFYFLHLYRLFTVTYSTETAECTTIYKTYFIEWNDTFSLCAKGKKKSTSEPKWFNQRRIKWQKLIADQLIKGKVWYFRKCIFLCREYNVQTEILKSRNSPTHNPYSNTEFICFHFMLS